MIYMAFALYCEAEPFIRHLNLKKNIQNHRIQVFQNDDVLLYITGSGAVAAAAATAYVCARFPAGRQDVLMNFGICASDKIYESGSLLRIHSIYEQHTKRWYYPDMIYSGIFEEAALETVPMPVHTMNSLTCRLADMEAAGIYQASMLFFEQHRVFFFKAVFDHPENADSERDRNMGDIREAREAAGKICGRWAEPLCRFMKEISVRLLDGFEGAALSEREKLARAGLAAKLRATEAMRLRLEQILDYGRLCGMDTTVFIDRFIEEHNISTCASKKEGARWIEAMRKVIIGWPQCDG